MAVEKQKGQEPLQFLDPTVNPTYLLDLADIFKDNAWSLRVVYELLKRLPSVEYAVGFDGVDDWILIQDIHLNEQSIDVEMEAWVSAQDNHSTIIDLRENSGNRIFTLGKFSKENQISAYYSTGDDIQEINLSRFNFESWESLRIWSHSDEISIEVNGKIVANINDIPIQEGEYSLYIGSERGQSRYLRGMVRKIEVFSDSNQIFKLISGNTYDVDDNKDSATIYGVHSMKKRRFQSTFSA